MMICLSLSLFFPFPTLEYPFHSFYMRGREGEMEGREIGFSWLAASLR